MSRHHAFFLGLVMLLLLGGLAWLLQNGGAKQSLPGGVANDFSLGSQAQDTGAGHPLHLDNEGDKTVPEAAGDESQVGQGLHVRIVDPAGLPVPNLAIKFHQHTLDDEQHVVSDELGEATLDVRNVSRATRVESTDERWLLSADVPFSRQTTVLEATPCVTVYLKAACARGTPWAERVYVRAGIWGMDPAGTLGSSKPAGAWECTVKLDSTEAVAVTKLPTNQDLRLWFRNYVVGFDEQWHTVSRDSLKHQEQILVVLTRNPNPTTGAVEIDLSGYTGRGVSLGVFMVGWSTQSGGARFPKNGFEENKWHSRPLQPGSYIARIDGEPVWEAAFEIRPGETTRLIVEPVLSGILQVRVLDEGHLPLAGAVMSKAADEYYLWDMPRRASDAFSDESGIATLNDQAPGAYRLLIEAEGYEPQFVDVTLEPGEYKFLGDVVLKQAMGRIEVNLTGRDEKKSYTVMLIQAGGHVLKSVRDIEGDQAVFTNLPQREYLVAVIVGRGGKPASVTVDLADQPNAGVTLDVSGLAGEAIDPGDKPR